MTTTSRGWPLGTRPAGTAIGTLLTGTIKVMCIGDSITLGHGTAPGDSFRCLLKARATAYGLTTDFIGARANGTCADNDHNGTDSLIATCSQSAKLSHPLNDVTTAQGDLQDYVHPRDPSGFKKLCDAIWPMFLNLTGRAADW